MKLLDDSLWLWLNLTEVVSFQEDPTGVVPTWC